MLSSLYLSSGESSVVRFWKTRQVSGKCRTWTEDVLLMLCLCVTSVSQLASQRENELHASSDQTSMM